jgi:hypothetical protein
MFPLPIKFYVYTALVLAAVLGLTYGHHEHNALVEYKAEVKQLADAQIAKNNEIAKQQEQINADTKKANDDRIASIHAMYKRMLNSRGGSVSTSNANATISVNGTTIDIVSLAEQCSLTTSKLVLLQNWIKENQKLNEH